MTQRKTREDGQETLQETLEEIEETPEGETLFQNPELLALQAQLEALKTENQRLPELEKGFKSLQQALSEKDKELKRRADTDIRIDGLQDTIEDLFTVLASRGEAEDFDPTKRQDILADRKKKRDEQLNKTRQQEIAAAQQEAYQKADAIYKRAESVFPDDENMLHQIRTYIRSGDDDLAEKTVLKAEQKKGNPLKEKVVETEEQRIDRLAQEKLSKMLEERGLLEEITSIPSVSGSAAEAMRRYIAGELTADAAEKMGAKFR